ncbi:3-methyl-2-oxobutanoate hydroxymethyltransferase [Cobetia sp. 5-11-6-3]|uniref:3-methyl-2-oxobutanoate hydroxymethyltransferase n=1 Tax=Cobetia sp. 5-11-6-3 TaxID=2737458 RepID=UPI00159682A3|nr:3-methyl-2-oxobutanoate hydroxymethyltransferase [Cobetia sp. 5-11-6-3]
MKNVTLSTLRRLKADGETFSCLTAYDATCAHLAGEAGIEVLLVGDSLGMVLQGHTSTLPVTIDDICYHTAAVARGKQGSLVMADLPFMSNASTEILLDHAARLMRAGAEMVKVEGEAWLAEAVTALVQRGVPVCVHMGLTPQHVHAFGGYKVQGREEARATQMIADARTLEAAGAAIILLECVPAELAARIRDAVEVPVIGIGAGVEVDGQILVMHDMLDLTPGRKPRFVKNFMAEASSVQDAFAAYHRAVKERSFPAAEHTF